MNTERTSDETMTTPDDGTLRAYLDHDPILGDAARIEIEAALVRDPALVAHVATLRMQRDTVASAFAPLAAPPLTTVQVEQAYLRILRTPAVSAHPVSFVDRTKETVTAMTTTNRPDRTRRFALFSGVGVVALALVLLFVPVGSLASAALDAFRYHPEKFAVITINTNELQGIVPNGTAVAGNKPGTKPAGAATKPEASKTPAQQQQDMQELAKYVTVKSSVGDGQLPGYPVKDAAEAKAKTGRAVNAPTFLPQGVANTPKYYVADKNTADATLNLDTIRPALAQAGQDAASLVPATGSTATVHVDIPAASIISYGFDPMAQGDAAKTQKGVAVIAMGVPTVDVQNLDVKAIVNVLAAMPNFPPTLVAQLRSADLSKTLIIPVTDQQNVQNGTFINGAPSTLISQKDGSGAVALSIKNDVLYIVIGTYDGATVQKVAQSIKP